MVSADNLNYDVLRTIFSFVGNNDLVSVCLVSQSFRVSALPCLYQKIYFRWGQTWPVVQSPFTTILEHPELAVLVRACEIRSFPIYKTRFIASCTKSLGLCHNMISFTCTANVTPLLPFLSSIERRLVDLKLRVPLLTHQVSSLTKIFGLHTLTLLEPSASMCHALMTWIPSMTETLTSVSILNSGDFNDTVLELIVRSLPRLRSLHIVKCAKIDHQAIMALLPSVPQLESLSVTTWERGFSSLSLTNPVLSLPNLRHFSIDTYNYISPWPFVSLFGALASSPLKSVTIKFSKQVEMSGEVITQLTRDHCATLQRLNLVNACVNELYMEFLCGSCTNLEQLSISVPRVEGLMNQFIDSITKATHLRTLIDVGEGHSISASSIREIFHRTLKLDKIISGNRCWRCDRNPSGVSRNEKSISDYDIQIRFERLKSSRNPKQNLGDSY